MSNTAMDRVVSELKATHDGELQWLLGDSHPVPPMNAHAANNGTAALEDRDVKLSDAYMNREKALTFLTDAFVELKKCRTLLRWSYPFALFRFEEDFRQNPAGRGMMVAATGEDEVEYKEIFCAVQGALERRTEALSDLIAHKRLRGSKDDIVEATLLAKTERIALEGIVVGNSQTLGSKSLEFSRSASHSVDERELAKSVSPVRSIQQQQSQRMQQASSSMQQSSESTVTSTSKVSSYMQAMEFDLAGQRQKQQATVAVPEPEPVVVPPPVVDSPKADSTKKESGETKKTDSNEDYGYNSGDDEGLQTLTDISSLKLDGSAKKGSGGPVSPVPTLKLQALQPVQGQEQQQRPQQRASSEKETKEVTTLEAGRSTQQVVEQTFTTITSKKIMTGAGSTLVSNDSGNSLMSDLTTQDNNGSGTPLTFTRMNKLSPLSPNKPPVDPRYVPEHIPHADAPKGPITTRGLTRQASKLFQKEIIEHISEEETTIVYQLMNKHKIDRDKAVRMYLEEHDERLYNPKAVYLFPGEVYTPVEEVDDEEEQRRKAELFGRVEYNHKTKEDTSDSYSVSTGTSVVEQRLIGAKKDPDQEALEHALLLSSQEDEFGINMYDSMSPEDHITLEEYMSQGFTREEGALIIFEEKFGKTRFTRNTEVIPAMPTLQPMHVHHSTGSLTDRSGRSGSYYPNGNEIEEDDPEVVDLMRRGYTREQAFAVIAHHREKALQAARTQHPNDPTFYDPHPREDQFNLSEREEREVQMTMEQRRCSRRVAVDIVVAARTSTNTASRSNTSNTSQNLYSAGYDDRANLSSEEQEVRRYVDRGYTREQALQLVRSKSNNRNGNSFHSDVGTQDQPSTARRPSYTSTNSGDNESALTSLTLEEAEMARYMNRGYSRDQAREMVRRDSSLHGNTSTYNISISSPSVPSSRVRAPPANLDPETAELVRQQNEDYGVNMFTAGTAEDDAVVERLIGDGYTYHQALLHVFSYRYPPRPPAPASYPTPIQQPVYQYQPQQSFYQPQQPPYGVPPAPYGSPAPYNGQGSFYQPNGGSFYQQSPPPAPMMPYSPPPGDMYGNPYPAPVPAAASNVNNNLARKPSSLGSSSNSTSGSNSKPPVLNGNQTSLLQQQRNQDAWIAQQQPPPAQPIEKKGSSNAMTRKGSFLGGIGGLTRKSAHTEDDLVARANYQADVENGKRDPDNKSNVPKLKYKEADVQKIVKMGFTRDQAVQALVENHQNVDEAVHTLTDR